MHFLFQVVLLGFGFFATSPVAAASSFVEYSVKEEVSSPRGWVKHSRPHPDHNIILRIGLPQPNFHILEKNLYEVSDPAHRRYGQHLSKSEVEALVAPHPESLNLVNEWLGTFGIDEDSLVRSPARDWVTLKVPVSLAEKMLDTTYHVWKHSESGDYMVRTTGYGLPSHLHDHIDVIQPTTMFARLKQQKSTVVPVPDAVITQLDPNAAGIDSGFGVIVNVSCNGSMTVPCLRMLYNVIGVPSAPNNSLAVAAYNGQSASIQDLEKFYTEQEPAAVGTTFTVVSVNGGINDPSDASAEANLDTQIAFGLAYPIPGTLFSTAGSAQTIHDSLTPGDTNEPYADWLAFVLNQTQLPLVISTSYGDDEQTVPWSFAYRTCVGFAQLGARGVSVLFASGDRGVGDGDPNPATQQCFPIDSHNVTKFIPFFPASCPYVTTVGGTMNIPEVGALLSGGGFSNYFSRPTYQAAAVEAYLKALPIGTYTGLFNPLGRAYPDVAAQSERFKIFIQGEAAHVSGTSASCPTFAALLSILNDARLKENLPPMGFLNPWLYGKGFAGFNDIAKGHNSGCGTQGFEATVGWDPVTGLGTPNFEGLKTLVLEFGL